MKMQTALWPKKFSLSPYDGDKAEYLRMIRIGDWIRFYIFVPLAGALLASATPFELATTFAIYFALIGYAFVVNNYFDVEIDRLHEGKVLSNKNPLASGAVSKTGVEALMASQVLILAVLSIYMSSIGTALVILNLVLFTAYSASRIRLKERPVLDIVTHGLMFGALPLLAGYALCKGDLSGGIIPLSIILFLLASEALIAHQVVEYSMDLRSTRTTITEIGQRRGFLILLTLAVLSVMMLLNAVQSIEMPLWIEALAIFYLLAYPVYSCRGVLHDICHSASLE